MRATHNHQKETKILGACYTSNVEENRDDPIGEHKHTHTNTNREFSFLFFFSLSLLEKWTHNQRLVGVVVMHMPFRWVQTTVPFVDFFGFFSLARFSLLPHPISLSLVFLFYILNSRKSKQVQNSNSQQYISHRSMATPIKPCNHRKW